MKLVKDLPPTGDGRAQVITLGVVSARWSPAHQGRGAPAASAGHAILCDRAKYLAFLVANGYQLAEVERVIVGDKTSDEVYDEYLAETGKE